MDDTKTYHRRRRLIVSSYMLFKKTQRYLPPVVRGFLGILLILLGMIGFLPILGFWMIPLGLALLATDIPPLERWFRSSVNAHRKKIGR